ncbi:DUF5615 family PIN-like protein [Microcoleus sp. herbarium19]|uniref:DUF5615 family PIN-like protein n=1 Tax=unclassified Microcoleus TaxID=2642155 RepID=UPI002FCF358B
MTEKVRFHLDESVESAIADGLRRRSIDVTTTPEVGLLGASDEEQVAFALVQGRVIFTYDADFLRIHLPRGGTRRNYLLSPRATKYRGNCIGPCESMGVSN